MEDILKNEITNLISQSKVVLFMKGTPTFPQCGFSSRAVAILKANGVEKEQLLTVNVLENENIRQGIKEYSNWPTIPQVYVNGEFIGGSDILYEMHENGELKKLLTS